MRVLALRAELGETAAIVALPDSRGAMRVLALRAELGETGNIPRAPATDTGAAPASRPAG